MEKKVDVTQKDLEAMKNEVALKTKELEDRDKELLTRDRASSDLEASTVYSMCEGFSSGFPRHENICTSHTFNPAATVVG